MKYFLTILVCFLFFALYVQSAFALTTFTLTAPSGTLQQGQNVTFTIGIDTGGDSLSSTSVGMTYDTQYLQYVSTSPGNTFTTVSADVAGTGKLILTGSSGTAFTGTGTFAYVTFKLIATGPGSTQLCTLFNPASPTPTPGATSTPGPTPTTGPTITPGGPTLTPTPTATPGPSPTLAPTNGAVPTSLPVSGTSQPNFILAAFFITVVAGSLFILKKT